LPCFLVFSRRRYTAKYFLIAMALETIPSPTPMAN
jgi:hypothetical protein